uniref:Uncharacterized protein n=1 Tax=Dunaliella tertiolecta TaxID=3047 RepID=A0A7S3VN97_DUNTE
MSDGEEQLLLQNWASSPKQAWFKEAWLFLQRRGAHWWCKHFAVTYHLAELLRYHQQPQVRLIWEAMSEQMASCVACTNSYHNAKALYAEEFEPQAVASLLSAMQLLDAQRLEAWFALASPLPPGQAPPDKVLLT